MADMASEDILNIHENMGTCSLDLEAFYKGFNSLFLPYIRDTAEEGEEVVGACTVCTDCWTVYYFEGFGDGYYWVDREAWANWNCSGIDWGACRGWGRDRADKLGGIGPSAYALDEVDTYMADNKKQADSLDFYYYLRSD